MDLQRNGDGFVVGSELRSGLKHELDGAFVSGEHLYQFWALAFVNRQRDLILKR